MVALLLGFFCTRALAQAPNRPAPQHKVSEVLINGGPTPQLKTTPKPNASQKKPETTLYLGRGSDYKTSKTAEYLEDGQRRDILTTPGPDYQVEEEALIQTGSKIANYNFPRNTLVIRFTKRMYLRNSTCFAYDLINRKQDRQFNTDEVTYITHLGDNLFFVGYGCSGVGNNAFTTAKIYDRGTSEFVATITEVTHSGPYEGFITPDEFTKNICFNTGKYTTGYTNSNGGLTTWSAQQHKGMDDLAGGADKWKAYFIVRDWNSAQHLYYIDTKDKVKKQLLDAETYRKIHYDKY
ncbi:hypothetical protein GO988_20210 [Hymenobacter sp. HMF4947]|uniref:DKNYY family protein n=1 Tax=Hymenobacter ginkgonis TaxID=2682976 RepID=A0A7K1TJU0_9BACT|nr:hypothetical protein [Hymenobacter ginkgonis]MVN78664.1 hypothetical protein [Hymenobacter ginkgonis]